MIRRIGNGTVAEVNPVSEMSFVGLGGNGLEVPAPVENVIDPMLVLFALGVPGYPGIALGVRVDLPVRIDQFQLLQRSEG